VRGHVRSSSQKRNWLREIAASVYATANDLKDPKVYSKTILPWPLLEQLPFSVRRLSNFPLYARRNTDYALIDLYHDKSFELFRPWIILALGQSENNDAEHFLETILDSEKNPDILVLATVSLIARGRSDISRRITVYNHLQDKNSIIRIWAIMAAGIMRDSSSIL